GAMIAPRFGGLLNTPLTLTGLGATVTSGRRSPLTSTGMGACGTPGWPTGRLSRLAVWFPEIAVIEYTGIGIGNAWAGLLARDAAPMKAARPIAHANAPANNGRRSWLTKRFTMQ